MYCVGQRGGVWRPSTLTGKRWQLTASAYQFFLLAGKCSFSSSLRAMLNGHQVIQFYLPSTRRHLPGNRLRVLHDRFVNRQAKDDVSVHIPLATRCPALIRISTVWKPSATAVSNGRCRFHVHRSHDLPVSDMHWRACEDRLSEAAKPSAVQLTEADTR